MDTLSKEERSKRMSLIRSKWTRQEILASSVLKASKIKHVMHPKIPGSPDIILKDKRIAIFLNGCFWHGCPRCYKPPQTNKAYWLDKVRRNKSRDAKNASALRKAGWSVIKLWEHEVIKNPEIILKKIRK